MEEKELGKMGTMPVKKLMLNMGIPMIISMMLQALYNIVDSAFVARMQGGEQALNALTLAFPVQMLMVAIGIGTGVGVNVLLSLRMGQREEEKAAKVAGNAIFLGIVITAVFMLFGIFGVKAYVSTQTQNPVIFEMAVTYLRICCIMPCGIVFFSIFEKLLQAVGLSLQSTIAQISGAVVNIILDPIMIYGLLGCPEMGVAGAAYATVIGQIVSFLVALIFHLTVNKSVKKGLCYIKPEGTIIREVYRIGFPAIIAQALMSVMTYGINIILVAVDEALVTAYGLYYKIQQFILFAVFGLRDAITPIVSFGNGMGSRSRITDGIKYGVIYAVVIMLIGTLLLEILAVPLCAMFGLSGITEKLCILAVRIISVSFVFAGLNVALQGVFQALGKGGASLAVSLCRQLVFVLPVAWIFTQFIAPDLLNAHIVWYTFIISEGVTAVISALLMMKIYRKDIKAMK
ncbi:MAG: MATE family efflux transporter [Oscillospiraceae bacterium]|nr:MATE family efflux transporter [Oscillospiraceae bacterium]